MPQHQQTANRESSIGDGPADPSSTTTPLGKPQRRSDWSSTGLRFQYRRAVIQTTPKQAPRPRRRLAVRPWKLVRLATGGCVAVVGESFYQPALVAITGRREWKEVQQPCTAILVLEPGNPHDPNAVRVEIKKQLVGYLSRVDAISYGPYLRRLARFHRLPYCEAVILGRGPGSDTQHMGVFLYVSAPGPELLANA
jgi:hypothetical protein